MIEIGNLNCRKLKNLVEYLDYQSRGSGINILSDNNELTFSIPCTTQLVKLSISKILSWSNNEGPKIILAKNLIQQ